MTPTYYLHRKTGGVYALLTEEYVWKGGCVKGEQIAPMYAPALPDPFTCTFTATDPITRGERTAFYVNAVTGERWARPSAMFHDGRFTAFIGVPELPGLIPLP